jgi:hypothetical protein
MSNSLYVCLFIRVYDCISTSALLIFVGVTAKNLMQYLYQLTLTPIPQLHAVELE